MDVASDVGGKLKTATVKNWEAVKATGGAAVSVISAPFKILYKTVGIKFAALKTLLGFKAHGLNKIVAHTHEKLSAIVTPTTTTTTTTIKPLPLKEIKQYIPAVFSTIHKTRFL